MRSLRCNKTLLLPSSAEGSLQSSFSMQGVQKRKKGPNCSREVLAKDRPFLWIFFPSRGCSAVELKEEVEEFNEEFKEDIRSLMASPFNFLFGELCGCCNRLLSIFSILPMASSNNVE